MVDMESLKKQLQDAASEGHLLPSALENILRWLTPGQYGPEVAQVISELVERRAWQELNDRFFEDLEFGTGGMRSRTIGEVITPTEQGKNPPGMRPELPAIGSKTMNFYNIRRATMGLCRFLLAQSRPDGHRPTLAIAHDTRHYSRAFAETAAEVASKMGVNALLFPEDRSTPQLSFTVREYGADAGVVITASHNPYHDNGYKVYYRDGAQVVEHADAIISEVKAVESTVLPSVDAPGTITILGDDADRKYLAKLLTVVLDPEAVKSRSNRLGIVFTPLHGTGARTLPAALKELGCVPVLVQDQCSPDGAFPTVKSPNPENQEALAMAIKLAHHVSGNLVLATDPDADRLGVGSRDESGEIRLLNGNQIGSLIAHYRLERMQECGLLQGSNTLIKTIVTTDLQAEIAAEFQTQCVETLTGFKFIGEKLRIYEEQACAAIRQAQPELLQDRPWHQLDEPLKRELLQRYSTYYVFGGEESYGYSAADFVRDKDANLAAVMLVDMACHLNAQGVTIHQYLDRIYRRFGYFEEKQVSLFRTGASGQEEIGRMMAGLRSAAPSEIGAVKVERMVDFKRDEVLDADGKALPNSNILSFVMANGFKIVARPSGTEPKIKFYILGRSHRPGERPDLDETGLNEAKTQVRQQVEQFADAFVGLAESLV
ncbi:MAG: phospho-sugar mutase [Verrucomicrobiota bacterium]|jgi:phosphoglucomutase